MQIKFVMSEDFQSEFFLADIHWAGMLTPEIIVILFTGGLLYVQCTKNRPTCKDYIASYKIFQEHQLNSARFPEVVDSLS